MTLYFKDSLGEMTVVAKDIGTPEEAMAHILNSSKTRFAVPKGKINIHCQGRKFTFTSSEGRPLGYTLVSE